MPRGRATSHMFSNSSHLTAMTLRTVLTVGCENRTEGVETVQWQHGPRNLDVERFRICHADGRHRLNPFDIG